MKSRLPLPGRSDSRRPDMGNPWSGEVTLELDGIPHTCKLTLGVLAELEEQIGAGSIVELAQRFEQGTYSTRDVLALIVAGLRGGGWQGTAADLRTVEIGGGSLVAAQAAALLLTRAFSVPGQG